MNSHTFPTRRHTGVYDRAVSGRALLGLQWRFVTEGDVIGSPGVYGDLVYVGSGDGRMYALDRRTGADAMSSGS